jgi:GT2 family glycosyltransferase
VDPQVSIVILSYFHPEVTEICLRTLNDVTEDDVDYEVVVVDNGSDQETLDMLRKQKLRGRIDTLVEEQVNHMFSGGNNIGVANTNPASKYLLLLNSDVAFMRPDWLSKMIGWMEGTIEHRPSIWPHHPTIPDPGPRDVVSLGWSHDVNIEGRVRPEGWCCLFRREAWRDMSLDFPWYYGFEEMVTSCARDGFKVGVLSQYGSYLVHREQGSSRGPQEHPTKRAPDLPGWFSGIRIESLDFTLGEFEHDSYLWW